MLRSIFVENLRCWAGRHEILLAPLTLLYGANSAGKSTLFHALDLLRQSLEQANNETAALVCNGPYINTGDFLNLIWQHQTKEQIEQSDGVYEHDRYLAFGISFDAPKTTKPSPFGITNPYRRIIASFAHAANRASGGELIRLDLQLGDFSFVFKRNEQGWILSATAETELKSPDYTIQESLDRLPDKIFDSLHNDATSGGVDKRPGHDAVAWVLANDFHKHQRFQLRRGLPVYMAKATTNKDITNRDAPEGLNIDVATGRIADAWFRHIDRFADEVSEELSKLRHLGPLRQPPARIQNTTVLTDNRDDVGFEGENIVTVLEKHTIKVRQMLRHLESGRWHYDVAVGSVELAGGAIGKAKYLKLRDTRRKGWEIEPSSKEFDEDIVSPRDVGCGVSQLLPVIVQIAAGAGLTCLIEQPEIHLHPRLQTETADILIEAVLGEQQHTLFVETHSEHLILRVLRRIRETSEHADLPKHLLIKPVNVNVLYIDSSANETKPILIKITESGEFAKRWPDGFFEERIQEL